MLIGEVKSLLRNTLSSTTVQTSGLEKLFAYLDDRWDLPESIEWLRLGLALRDVYLSPRWRAAVVAFGSLVVHGCLYAYMRSCVRGIEFKERRKQRRIDRDEALQVLEDELKNLKLSEEEIEHIVSCNVPDLVSKLQSGELLATQVLHAFQWKALSAHKKTNCLTGLVIEAEEWAVALDKLPRDERGPLHGIPISVKENFPLAGYDCTKGASSYLGLNYESDCAAVEILKSLGAVPFVRTNMPQLGLSFDSSNPIYGTTCHPLRSSHCPGGSSSGEAALIALKGSPLGFGSDSGGSIRCPAAWCGVTSIKPTYARISSDGRPDFNGQNIIPSISSPIAPSVASLAYAMQVLSGAGGMHAVDAFSPSLPFAQEVYKSKRPLKIGVFTFDGFCQPIPACESIVIEASEHLSSLGHEIVEWSPPDPHLAFWYAVSIMSGDGGQSTHKEILNDELSSDVLMLYHVPITLRRIIARVIKPFNPFNSTLLRLSCGVRSVPDWWHLTLRIQEYRQRVISSWKESGLDVIICPSFATPALPLNNEISLHAGNYCMLFNVLNFPAGVVPRGEFSDDDVEEVRSDYPEDTAYQRKIKQCVLQDSVGLPLSVQCVSLPWQEELCLRVMNELET